MKTTTMKTDEEGSRDGDRRDAEIKVGDVVALPEFGGAAVDLGDGAGKEYFMYREEEIVGVVE